MRCGVDERVRGQHVEGPAEVPEVALERHDAGHRGAHQVPVAVVLLVGHEVGPLAEAAEVRREHDVAGTRELIGVVVARATRHDAAHQVLARSVAVDREHGGSGRVARVRHEQVRGHRHRALGVEDDAVAAVRAAIHRVGRLDVEWNRVGHGPEERAHPRVGAYPPLLELLGIVGEGIGARDRVEVQAPVRPVGEVAPAGHEVGSSAQASPPARWRRYAGDSHAPGK